MFMRFLFAEMCLIVSVCYASADEVGNASTGLEYAKENCTECHAVQRGEHQSPNSKAPTFGEIANTPGMSQLALIAFFQTPHHDMPNFMIPSANVRDLVAYITSLKE